MNQPNKSTKKETKY